MAVITNLLSNPSGQRALTGYTLIGSGSGPTLNAPTNPFTYALTTTGGVAIGNIGIRIQVLTVGTDLQPNTQYTFAVDVMSYLNGSPVVYKKPEIAITGAGVVATVVLIPSSAPTSLTRYSVTFTTAASGSVNVLVLNGEVTTGGSPNVVAFRNAQVELGSAASAYVDGSLGPGYFWSGTADASPSSLYLPVVATTVSTDANPCPRCLVAFSDLYPTAQTITVYRVAEGRQFKVRGGVKLFAVGGVAVMDFEVPFDTAATYRAEMFDSSGNSLGFTPGVAVTIDSTVFFGNTSRAWVHQPLNPSLAVQVNLQMGTAADLVRTNPGATYWAEGASVGTRVGGRRQGVTQMPLVISVDSTSDGDEFQAMFGDYNASYPAVVCIRAGAPVRLPRTFFATGDPDEQYDYVSGMMQFSLTVDETQPPAPGLVIPTLRRADIDAAFSTRAARAAAYSTRFQRDTDYSKAGLAG